MFDLFRSVKKLSVLNKTVTAFLIVFIIGMFGILADEQDQLSVMYGDMSTYISQAYSFAYDLDNTFEEKDLIRFIKEVYDEGPVGLFINEYGGVYSYSKPFIYGLILAPFVSAFGTKGVVVCNWLLFLCIIYMTYSFLTEKNSWKLSLLFAVVFWCFSFAISYIFVAYADIFIAFLVCSILYSYNKYLLSYSDRGNAQSWLILCATILGIGVYQRTQIIFLAFVLFLDICFVKRNWKDSIYLFLGAVLPFAVLSFIQIIQTGHYSCYKGNRCYIKNFPEGLNFKIAELQLKGMGQTEAGIIKSFLNSIRHPKDFLYNCVYYLIGRQTGIFWYAPFVLCIVFMWNWRNLKKYWYAIAFVLLYAVFFFLQNPSNYYGGGTSFGNRYFLQVMPAMVFSLGEIRNRRLCNLGLFACFLSCITLGGVFSAPKLGLRDAKSYVFRDSMQCFPFEWTAYDLITGESGLPVVEVDDATIMLTNTYNIEDRNGFWTKAGKKCKLYIKNKNEYDQMAADVTYYDAGKLQTEHMIFDTNVVRLSNGYYSCIKIDLPYKYYPIESGVDDARGLGVYINNIKFLKDGKGDLTYQFGEGFYGEESNGEKVWRWSDKEAVILFDNEPLDTNKIGFVIEIGGYGSEEKEVRFDGCGIDRIVTVREESQKLKFLLDLSKGKELKISSSSESKIPGGKDGRLLNFKLSNCKIIEESFVDESKDNIIFYRGFYNEESIEDMKWRWANKEAEMVFDTLICDEQKKMLNFEISCLESTQGIVHISGCGVDEMVVVAPNSKKVSINLDFKKGNTLRFISNVASQKPRENDDRELNFMITDWYIS